MSKTKTELEKLIELGIKHGLNDAVEYLKGFIIKQEAIDKKPKKVKA
jgi:hypothetical protein